MLCHPQGFILGVTGLKTEKKKSSWTPFSLERVKMAICYYGLNSSPAPPSVVQTPIWTFNISTRTGHFMEFHQLESC